MNRNNSLSFTKYIKEVSLSSVVDAELNPLCFGGICQNANAGMREIQICGMYSPAASKPFDQFE
jgi:hypothetical protein